MKKEKLIDKRTEKGFSQEDLAKELCIAVSGYNRREKGDIKITKQEWEKLAKILECQKEDIYDEDENKKLRVNYDNSTFNDVTIGVNYGDIIPSIIENLQDFILHLKERNQSLEIENKTLQEEIKQLKNRLKELEG